MSTVNGIGATMEWTARFEPESPFAEALPEAVETPSTVGFVPWTESFTPFAESASAMGGEAESELEEMLAELRDEAFDEALVDLVTETEEAVGERFMGEGPLALGPDQERLADAHLAPVQFEAEQYLDRLAESLAGLDVESLSEHQLDEMIDRYDPSPGPLSPAGEEFVGALVRKTKKVMKAAGRAARKVGSAVGRVAMAGLKRLRRLVRPLLRRVLSMAINRLPAPLRPAAQTVARRIGLEAELEAEIEAEGMTASLASLADPEWLAESFDAAVAEAVLTDQTEAGESESLNGEMEDEGSLEGRQLENLTEARSALIDRFGQASDSEDLAPAIEQFVPALLGALRLGIRVVGRPKVVAFLARYLARLIRPWVGPAVSGPLSSAVVDTGLRLISLESPGEREDEAAPALLAATVEDTVRRLAEAEEYVLEDEDLLQLAVGDAFEQAVASTFPAQLVRPELHQAPTLGGTFVLRHPRRTDAYRKYTRVPEVELTAQVAAAIRTFGGTMLAASLQAAGRRLPMRARVHVFEATAGTRLPRLARLERRVPGLGSPRSFAQLHPLTPEAAGLLLREPRLGVAVPPVHLRSRHRIAVGQRFYYLEPVGSTTPMSLRGDATRCADPSQGWAKIDLIRSEVTVALYVSEVDAQAVAASLNQGRGTPALLKALTTAYDGVSQSFEQPSGRVKVVKELEEGEELAGPVLRRVAPVVIRALQRKVGEWTLRILAEWARARGTEFARTAADPACGVTVTATMRAVPGLNVVRQALNGRLGISDLRTLPNDAFRGSPTGSVAVVAGKRQP